MQPTYHETISGKHRTSMRGDLPSVLRLLADEVEAMRAEGVTVHTFRIEPGYDTGRWRIRRTDSRHVERVDPFAHPCPCCDASGRYRGQECPWCCGDGHVDADHRDLFQAHIERGECWRCEGDGIGQRGGRCPVCGGDGKSPVGREEEIAASGPAAAIEVWDDVSS